MSSGDNPYSPPTASDPVVPASQTRVGWRVLAVVLCLAGGISLAVGLFAASLATVIMASGRASDVKMHEMMAACTLYLGFGMAWILSGRCFWVGRLRFGLITCAAGVALPVCLFAIFGF